MGYSAILFADTMRRSVPAERCDKVRLVSIEFEEKFAEIARQFVEIAGLKGVIEVVIGDAETVMRKMKAAGQLKEGEVDLLFLDHVEDLYEKHFRVAWEELGLLRKGGLAVADNVLRPGAPAYRAFVRESDAVKSHGVEGLIIPGDFAVSETIQG